MFTMNKISIALLTTIIFILAASNLPYAFANEISSDTKFNQNINIENNSTLLGTSGQGKEKSEFKIKSNNDDSEFMIKGVISAFSTDSLTIDGKTIIIDSSVTEENKIVGKIETGAYAMVKGIIKDSKYYAKKIVVDSRNKINIEENETLSPTPTPLLTATAEANLEDSEKGGFKVNFNMKFLFESLKDILNSFKNLFQTI